MTNGIIAILNVFCESKVMDKVAAALIRIPEVTNVYQVTGECSIVAFLATATVVSLRELLKNKVLKIEGITSAVTSIVLEAANINREKAFSQLAK